MFERVCAVRVKWDNATVFCYYTDQQRDFFCKSLLREFSFTGLLLVYIGLFSVYIGLL